MVKTKNTPLPKIDQKAEKLFGADSPKVIELRKQVWERITSRAGGNLTRAMVIDIITELMKSAGLDVKCHVAIYSFLKNATNKHRSLLSAHWQRKVKSKRPGGGVKFLDSQEWLTLRYQILLKYGRKCMCCNTTEGEIHVDHIKPRSKYPELALDPDNLQVLCKACNLGNLAWDETDFRPKQPEGVA